MKKWTKITMALAILVTLLCLIGGVQHLMAKREIYEQHRVRPESFPEILIAPVGAVSLDHSTPSNSRGAPHSYSLSFVVYDPYPSENTCDFIEKHLRSKGWQRLNYDLLNPNIPREYPNPIIYQLRKDANDLERHKNETKKWSPRLREDWVNKNNEHISVFLFYTNSRKKEKFYDKADVDLTFYSRKSWVYPWILKYKELHPEEFQAAITTNDTNNQ